MHRSPLRRRAALLASSASLLGVLAACGGDSSSTKAPPDPGPSAEAEAGSSTGGEPEGGSDAANGVEPEGGREVQAQLADGGDPTNEVIPKSACALLTAAEVGAVLGFAVNPGEEHSGGEQCDYNPADPSITGGALLEEVPNGKNIYAATLDEWASTNMQAVPVAGVGDQASFTSHEGDGSSMQTTKGDLVLRLNLGFDPDRATDQQIAAETQLLQSALGRL